MPSYTLPLAGAALQASGTPSLSWQGASKQAWQTTQRFSRMERPARGTRWRGLCAAAKPIRTLASASTKNDSEHAVKRAGWDYLGGSSYAGCATGRHPRRCLAPCPGPGCGRCSRHGRRRDAPRSASALRASRLASGWHQGIAAHWPGALRASFRHAALSVVGAQPGRRPRHVGRFGASAWGKRRSLGSTRPVQASQTERDFQQFHGASCSCKHRTRHWALVACNLRQALAA